MSAPIPDFNRDVHCLLGLPFDVLTLRQAVTRVRDAARDRKRCFFSTPNLNFLIAALTSAEFRNSVLNSDISLADGMSIVWLGKMLGIPLTERVAGSDVFDVLRADGAPRIKVYFFGGPNGVAEQAARAIEADAPGMECVGHYSPGFGNVAQMSDASTIDAINRSGADLLVVSLGAKKGQAWIVHNIERLSVPAISHLGAVVNFVAGQVRRAPPWMRKLGLEWAWRIREEPQLWRRYYTDILAVTGLLLTRVMPVIYADWRNRQTPPVQPELSVQTNTGGPAILHLSGSWSADTLQPLRKVLSDFARQTRDLDVEISKVTHFDKAFLGLMLLLYGHLYSYGRRLRFVGVSQRTARYLHWNAVSFLLERQ
jgi:N-acetylglucosaminyldiphosphoundecaprenol N-acetyl-beta-D-mannosaminyltransferase